MTGYIVCDSDIFGVRDSRRVTEGISARLGTMTLTFAVRVKLGADVVEI